MIVVITGGRDFDDRDLLYEALDKIHAETPITVIRNGGMTGADALSSRWAYDRKVDTQCIGAQWRRYGSSAGPRRNIDMLNLATDLVVAFPGGRGTRHTIAAARDRRIPVREVTVADGPDAQ